MPEQRDNRKKRPQSPKPDPRPPLELPALGAAAPAPARFGELCAEFGLEVDEQEIDRLGRFVSLLLATNERMNLTSIKDPNEAWVKHIFDSLTLLGVMGELVAEGERLEVMDVGAGGGMPSIPLAIAAPGIRFTLFEATAKKCAFLTHAAKELGLDNVRLVNKRAEAAGRPGQYREKADVGICRALGRMVTASELVMPLVRVGGVGVFVKGERAGQELEEAEKALAVLGATHAGTFETPTGRLVILEKENSTPKAYPRSDGLPKREPIGLG